MAHKLWTHLGCSSTQFTCSNGQCVPISARCNNVNECTDGSDEQNCGMKIVFYMYWMTNHRKEISKFFQNIHINRLILTFKGCAANQFMCTNGACIPVTSRCDGVGNCHDNSDERNCGKIENVCIYLKWIFDRFQKVFNFN